MVKSEFDSILSLFHPGNDWNYWELPIATAKSCRIWWRHGRNREAYQHTTSPEWISSEDTEEVQRLWTTAKVGFPELVWELQPHCSRNPPQL